jgi:hypothetical protein
MDINSSPTLVKYKDTLQQCLSLYYRKTDPKLINDALDYSIAKRVKDANIILSNSYKRYRVKDKDENGHEILRYQNLEQNARLLQISDYIISRQPIVTAYGTMFKHHGEEPNPLFTVIQSFLDKRSEYKNTMFSFPKGSEMFEKYNLSQLLEKINANGIYGCLGQYSALIYNSSVATSITSGGRAAVSSMTLHFEMFLANNVKFGSLNELVEFINHICNERGSRKFNDLELLNHIPTKEECFAKLILDTGYRWVPNDDELDIIWRIVNNLTQEDITRIYYKNNLYEFVSNTKVLNLVTNMLRKLKRPYYTSVKVPEEIADDLNLFKDLCWEYVYYRYMYIDRIDRVDNIIKSVTMVSDTDSTIISLDAWYRFIVNHINGEELRIANYCPHPVMFIEKDEDTGDWVDKPWMEAVTFKPKKLDYNFYTDEIEEPEHFNNPDILTPNDNVRYSIISIMGYVLDRTVNDYMKIMCRNNNSIKEGYHEENECKIWAKSEFLFKRLMMVPRAKKNYASLIEIQEGNIVPPDAQLDVKGIEAIHKSSKPLSTRKALQKILLEDILKAPVIDQLRLIKDIAIFEKQIIESVKAGSKEFYKPVTIKSMSAYTDPMKIQGIKASIAWNLIKSKDLEGINLDERNAINIAKVNINKANIEDIRESHPVIYENMYNALNNEVFKKYINVPKKSGNKPNKKFNELLEKFNAKDEETMRDYKLEFDNNGNPVIKKYVSSSIDAIALPLDVKLPKWLEGFIDYNSIIADNLNGFPYESIGIQRLNKSSVSYTNMVQL